jgi:hypothetical protein
MAKKTRERRSRPRKRRRRAPPPRRPPADPTLVTPEGDPLLFVRARYRLGDRPGDERSRVDEIAQLLNRAPDFGEGNEVDVAPGEKALQFPWYETDAGAKPLQEPMDRRVLAMLTLTDEGLEIETMSQQRMDRCRRRLEGLLGTRVELVETRTKTVAEVLAEPPSGDAQEQVALPPEVVAEMEERMLRQWLDASIPALDGMTPWEAARTPEGRQMLEDLFEYIERRYPRDRRPPGTLAPDYRKARELLGMAKE